MNRAIAAAVLCLAFGSATQAAGTYVLNERFDAMTTNAAPSGGWVSTATSGSVQVREYPFALDKSVRIEKAATSGESSLSRTVAGQSGNVAFEAKVMTRGTSGFKACPYIYDGNCVAVVSVAFSNGNIVAYDKASSSFQTVQSFVANDWYVVRVVINTTTSTYDLFVDGVRKLNNVAVRNNPAAGSLSQIKFYMDTTNTGVLLVDNVKVWEVDSFIGAPPAPIFDVRDYGAVGDGVTNDTAAIQNAINACAGTGGSVYLGGSKSYLTGTLYLQSNMTFFVDTAAQLQASTNGDDFPKQSPPTTNNQLLNCRRAHLYAAGVTNLKIDGGGTIYGSGNTGQTNGVSWTDGSLKEAERPMTIWTVSSNNVTIQNIYIRLSAMWTIVPMETDNVLIKNVLLNVDLSPTRDGVDIVDCHHTIIQDCTVYTGDDSFCPKTGIRRGVDDLLIKDCFTAHTGANSYKFGTASYGGFSNALIQDCYAKNAQYAAMVVMSRNGADVSNINFSRVEFSNCGEAFFVFLGQQPGHPDGDVDKLGSINNVHFTDILCSPDNSTSAGVGSLITGQIYNGTTYSISNLFFTNCNITFKGGRNTIPADPPEWDSSQYPEADLFGDLPAYGYYMRHINGVTFTNCTSRLNGADVRPEKATNDVTGLSTRGPGLDASSNVFLIVLENHNWSSIKGSADAPYLNNTVLPMASYCDQYYNPPGLHPSEPNYLWLEAGTNFGITNDNPPSSNHQSTTSHFVTQLKNAGISWKTYQESIDGLSCPTAENYPYAVRHNPFAFFDDVTSSGCTAVMRPLPELASDIGNNTLAHYNFITPNVCSDGHDPCAPTNNPIKQTDDWLAANLPTILNSPQYQNNGAIFITWDEGESGSDGPIGMIVLSPFAKGSGYHNAARYTHSSTLRTLQKIFGRTPLLGGAASTADLSDLFIDGAIPGGDSPSVTTTSASNVAGGNATLGGTFNPNADQTQYWFEYGLTNSYGSDTRSRSSDNYDSYSSIAYGTNGGAGFGAITYREGSGGGIYLETGSGKIDGAKSFGLFSSTGGQAADRQLVNAKQAGTLSLSLRFNVNNNVAFSGFNLKSAQGSTFGANELISIGIKPFNGSQFGNNVIAVNGVQAINLGTSVLGQVVDFTLSYDGLSGTFLLGAKLRSSNGYTYYSGNLKASGVTPAYLGFGNFNTGTNQNVIYDSISLVDSDSVGNGTSIVAKTSAVAGLTPNTTYHYRAVAQNTRGTSYGADQTFGFPLLPAANAAYHSTSSGDFQARIYDDTGHIAIAQPDLAGNPLASIITFAPASAKIGGATYDFGSVQSVTSLPNGLHFVQSLAGTTVTAQLTFATDGVMHYEVTNWNGLAPTQTNVTAASDVSEHFYGFGEKFNSFDQAGNKVHMMTSDIGGDKGDYSYKSSPWFISTKGYGFQLDSTAESYFDMRNGAADRYTIQNLFGTLKFNVVAGPKLTDVLARYTGYTGRPYLPPPWVFGTWVSSDIWRTGGEVRYATEKHIASGIPISVFVFDSPWEVSYNDFTWNMTQFGAGGTYEGVNYNGFSSLGEMMSYLQQHGVKVICWFTPFLNTSSVNDNVGGAIPGQNTGKSPNYDFAANNGYFVKTSTSNSAPLTVGWWKGTGSPIDFTNPAARTWFTSTQLQPLVNGSNVVTANSSLEPAIAGFKTDDGESINSGSPYIPTTAAYFDGRTGLEMQNGYCIEYHKTVSSVLGANGILFARSGFTGTGAFPAGWPGDNQPNYTQTNGLESVITAGDSAAMSGYSVWGHDIGGYQNANFTGDHADLFMRWAQYGAFTPIMQMHRQVNPANLEQYPWGYGSTALANYVSYAKLHSQLFPYIYTYAKEASMTGLPIIRPEVLLNQTDTGTYGIQHTYYFGNELLVAPMNAANSTSRNVYLPAGNWYDYWTNAKYVGGTNVGWSNADTTKIPLFVREGSVVPMLASVPQTLCDANYVNNPAITTIDSAVQFLVYPGATPASFTMYDNTAAQVSSSGTVTTLNLSAVARPISFKVLATSAPAGVERNGTRLPQFGTLTDFANGALGWFYDGAAKFLYVKFQHGGGNATVTFGPDSVGDGIPDSWRSFYGIADDTADADGDGLTNAQEYRAGTNPLNAGDSLNTMSTARTQSGFTITWKTVEGIGYRIEWKNALGDATWQQVPQDFAGSGGILQWTDDGSQTGGLPAQRFYRIRVP